MLHDASPQPHEILKFIGRHIGQVTILKQIGRGGRGIVFSAFQKSLKRQVAVKILLKKSSISDKDYELFLNEAEIIASLTHPNILPIYDMGIEHDCFYYIMQYVDGADLNQIINNRYNHPITSKRLIPLHSALSYFIQILDGMSYAHTQHIIHHDIKPSNILIEKHSQRPMIADFGIAKNCFFDTSVDSKTVTGSPLYLSPEQAHAQQTDIRTDIYSLGILLFKMLAGKLPYTNETNADIIKRKVSQPHTIFIQKPRDVSPHINEILELIIYKAIDPDPYKRYQKCTDFKKDIENVIQNKLIPLI